MGLIVSKSSPNRHRHNGRMELPMLMTVDARDLLYLESQLHGHFPNTVVTIREGARALDPGLEEMATVFAMPWQTRIQHVVLPQLAPYIAAATRAGLSLVWKIVLVVELMGRSNGVGFEIGNAFQLFDVALLLAYALPFVAIMLAIETFLVQPFENYVSRWRPKAA